jgi:hypothetical protein
MQYGSCGDRIRDAVLQKIKFGSMRCQCNSMKTGNGSEAMELALLPVIRPTCHKKNTGEYNMKPSSIKVGSTEKVSIAIYISSAREFDLFIFP